MQRHAFPENISFSTNNNDNILLKSQQNADDRIFLVLRSSFFPLINGQSLVKNALFLKWSTVCDICHLEACSTIITSIRLASHTAHINPLAQYASSVLLCYFIFFFSDTCMHANARILIHITTTANVNVLLMFKCLIISGESGKRWGKVFGSELRLKCRLSSPNPASSSVFIKTEPCGRCPDCSQNRSYPKEKKTPPVTQ